MIQYKNSNWTHQPISNKTAKTLSEIKREIENEKQQLYAKMYDNKIEADDKLLNFKKSSNSKNSMEQN